MKKIIFSAVAFSSIAIFALAPKSASFTRFGAPLHGPTEIEKVFQLGNFESSTPVETFGRVKFKIGETKLTRPVVAVEFYSGTRFSFPKELRIFNAACFGCPNSQSTVILPPVRKSKISFKSASLPSGEMASLYITQIGSLTEKYSLPVKAEIPLDDALENYPASKLTVLIFDQKTQNWVQKNFAFDVEEKTASFEIDESTAIVIYKKGSFVNLSAPVNEEVEINFVDAGSSKVTSALEKLGNCGGIEEVKYFYPEQLVTRGFAIEAILKSFGIQKTGDSFSFAKTARENGIAVRNAFNSTETLRKIDLVAMILKAGNFDLSDVVGDHVFRDISTNSWQNNFAQFAVENGILEIYGQFLNPRQKITRGQFAVMLSRALQLAGK